MKLCTMSEIRRIDAFNEKQRINHGDKQAMVMVVMTEKANKNRKTR